MQTNTTYRSASAKQTARNNPFLRAVKRDWNAKIYAACRATMNEHGTEAAIEYLGTHIREELRDAHLIAYRALVAGSPAPTTTKLFEVPVSFIQSQHA